MTFWGHSLKGREMLLFLEIKKEKVYAEGILVGYEAIRKWIKLALKILQKIKKYF